MARYRYEVSGTGGTGTTWKTTGFVESPREGDFPALMMEALRTSFQQITTGKDVEFGSPGPCGGPYHIQSLKIERCDAMVM